MTGEPKAGASRISARMVEAAIEAAGEVLALRDPADGVLTRFFRAHKDLGMRERAFVAETLYTVLRRRRTLEHRLEGRSSARRLVLAALVCLSGVGARSLAEILGEKNARALSALKAGPNAPMTPAERMDLPDWLYERLRARMDEAEIELLARGLNRSADLDLRVNPLKAGRDEVLDRFHAEGIAAEPGRYSPLAIRLKAKPALQRHPLYLSGAIEVQDEGSQLVGFLLRAKRGEMVADFCAGAGGKTLLLGALMRSQGRLYAFDVSAKRLARLRARCARAGLSNVYPICIARENDPRIKRLAGKLDRVLVDVPCSGLGTLRRNPDLKWRQSPQSVAELALRQRAILAAAARLPRPGGRLVYATCSILPEENGEVVAEFLAAHPDYRIVPAAGVLAEQGMGPDTGEALELVPHLHGTDAFYAVVMERAA
ncbi:MAG: SAM-dependent methyltransferase [Rhodocyclales bacterium CG_4_9_14_3_um_filter_68_10]|nr:MAG: SAM-dependent methyltransferase [Rhodocyclales bacterium CG_4_9_14_3_um_filter_68_10]